MLLIWGYDYLFVCVKDSPVFNLQNNLIRFLKLNINVNDKYFISLFVNVCCSLCLNMDAPSTI